jgi:GT2 family glycosyltransferase
MIGVVVVGFNNHGDLKGCLGSLLRSRYKKFKIIYVDNGSTDGSVEFVEKNFQEVIVIKNRNTGYAGGNNLGIKKALKLKCEYVFLLNPDTLIDQDCLGELVKHAKANKILQPLILIHEKGKKTDLINTTGNHLNYLGISYCNNYRQKSSYAKSGQITSASGAGMFIPSLIIKKIGFFDESFFMYHEDLDFNWRARKAGFDVELITSAKLWHKYKFSKNKLKYFYIERNRFYFIFKNYEIKTILLIFPFLLLNEILMILYSLLSGWFIYKLRSAGSFIYHLPRLLRNRRRVKWLVRDKELKKYFSSEIYFSEVKVPLLGFYSLLSQLYYLLIRKFI